MGIWVALTVLSGLALYLSASLRRMDLVLATAFATALGLFMMGLRVLLQKKVRRQIRVR